MRKLGWKKIFLVTVNPGKLFLRRDFPVFLICLLISATLWLIIRFSQPYDQVIEIPLRFTGMGKNLALVSYSDSVIRLKASLRGLQMVSYKYIHRETFDLDISTLKTRPLDAIHYRSDLPVKLLLSDLTSQLGTQVSLISPDTLHLVLEKRLTRRLPVKPQVEVELPQGMMLADSIRVSPSSVEITGPVSIVESLSFVSTARARLGLLSNDANLTLPLQKPVAGLPFLMEPAEVEVTVTVDKFTEGVAEVPVSLADSATCKLRLIPDKVKLHLVMPMRRYKDFDPTSCLAQVSCPSSEVTNIKTLPVKLVKLPSFVKCIEIEPPVVEFLILE
ncbi:MAG: CdaR family protein [Bacteroidales bacterium]